MGRLAVDSREGVYPNIPREKVKEYIDDVYKRVISSIYNTYRHLIAQAKRLPRDKRRLYLAELEAWLANAIKEVERWRKYWSTLAETTEFWLRPLPPPPLLPMPPTQNMLPA